MKTIIEKIGLVVLTLLIAYVFFKGCEKEPIDNIPDKRIIQEQQIQLRIDSLLVELDNAKDIYHDSINEIRSASSQEIKYLFNTIYSTDTIIKDSFLIDVESARLASIKAVQLDSCLAISSGNEKAFNLCRSSNELLRDMNEDYLKENALWHKKDSLKWYQCIKKKKIRKQINKLIEKRL